MPDDLNQRLASSVRCIEKLGKDYRHLVTRLDELRKRLSQGQFHLAVLGQFKRGKSTLLNALLGDAVLPMAVVPLTAIPTFIRSGGRPAARIHFQDHHEPQNADFPTADRLCVFLSDFVTETGNPKNKLGVSQVEVFLPAALLSKGVVLIDTPGIGSTLRHNTEATLNFLPQCDAALFLISADPPITEVEIKFLQQVRSKVSRLLFILNKVDYLREEDRRLALEFLRKVLTEQAGVPKEAVVFCVSARQGLEARIQGNKELWSASGMADVEQHLVEFFANEKANALREAVGRKAADTLGEALMRLRLAMQSLLMPLQELQQRLTRFETKIEEIRRLRISAGDLLMGDKRRMHEFLEEHADQLRHQALAYLGGVVQEALAHNGQVCEEEVRNVLAESIPGYFEHQVGKSAELFQRQMTDTLRRHQQQADKLIESVRETAAELFDVPYHAPESADAFQLFRQPYWVTHKWSETLSPIPPSWLDRLFPISSQQRRIRKRLLSQVSQLVVHNVENLRWAIFQSIDQTFTQFGMLLDERLAGTIDATHGAIRAALERRRKHSEANDKEAAQLEMAVAELESLRSVMSKG